MHFDKIRNKGGRKLNERQVRDLVDRHKHDHLRRVDDQRNINLEKERIFNEEKKRLFRPVISKTSRNSSQIRIQESSREMSVIQEESNRDSVYERLLNDANRRKEEINKTTSESKTTPKFVIRGKSERRKSLTQRCTYLLKKVTIRLQ